MDGETPSRLFGGQTATGYAPRYRAVAVKGSRRGLRLEEEFWSHLSEIAKTSKCRVGDLIAAVDQLDTGHNNTTSSVRVACLKWALTEIEELRLVTSDQMIRSLIYACSSPAIALSTEKRLHSFNQPFLHLVTQRFSLRSAEKFQQRLRLLLDVQIDVIVSRLSENGNQPVPVGISIGMDNRSMRSSINAILAPQTGGKLVLGYFVM